MSQSTMAYHWKTQAYTKWPMSCRHFQVHFLERKLLIQFSHKFIPLDLIVKQQRLGAKQVVSHNLNPWWPRWLTHMCSLPGLNQLITVSVKQCHVGCSSQQQYKWQMYHNQQCHVICMLKMTTPLTHLPLDKMAIIFQDDIFKCIFMNEKFCVLIPISLKFVPKGPIKNIPALVQIMAWRLSGDKPLSEQMLIQFTDAYTMYAALVGDELRMVNGKHVTLTKNMFDTSHLQNM